MTDPLVMGEVETLQAIVDSTGTLSLARLGDGEIKLARGAECKSQCADPELAERMRDICRHEHPERLLVAIPRIWGKLPAHKSAFWIRYRDTGRYLFTQRAHPYGSAFVSRIDHYPKLDNPDYWGLWRSIWQGRKVLFVRGGDESGKAPSGLIDNAASIDLMECPQQDAWDGYPWLLPACREWGERNPGGLVVACLGATATVLAADLSAAGVQGIDAGHTMMFARRSACPTA